MNKVELATVLPLLALSLFLGIYPKPLLDRVEPSVKALISHVESRSDYHQPRVADLGPKAVASSSTPKEGGK